MVGAAVAVYLPDNTVGPPDDTTAQVAICPGHIGIGEQARRFNQLNHDIADKGIADDDVGPAAPELVTF